MAFLNNAGLERLWGKITTKLNTKVDKVSGKGLSTNDYTTAEKNKLAGIATGATKVTVDSALSSSSTNPVQNKVVNTEINGLKTLVGDTAVSTQITNAISSKRMVYAQNDEPTNAITGSLWVDLSEQGEGNVTAEQVGALPSTGGTLTGTLNMNNNLISNLKTPTANAHAANKEYVDTATRKAAPRNLLDNSDFRNPVNQRGNTSYSGDGYSIDRWDKNANSVLTLEENGILFDTTTSNSIDTFIQKIDEKTKDYLIGKKVTLAIKTQDGVFFKSDTVSVDIDCCMISNDIFSLCLHFFTDVKSYQAARLVVKEGKSVLVEWIALYEGEYTAETLPEYQPKGYAAEFMECQRYLFKIADAGCDYAIPVEVSDSNHGVFDLLLPVEMRVPPSIFVYGSGMPRTVGVNSAGATVHVSTVTGLSLYVSTKQRVSALITTAAGAEVNYLVSLTIDTLGCGAIFLSAEL